MIDVYKIPVPKDRLRAMPKDERALLLLLGYASNQLYMMQKLLLFSTNKTAPMEVEQILAGAQTQMLLRLCIGVLNEAWLLIDRLFNRSPIAKDYLERLDPEGREALASLKKQFGSSNFLNSIRNDFAFHYPKIDEVDEAVDSACNDVELDEHFNLYFSESGFNSFYLLSDLMIVHGIREGIGAADLKQSQTKIMKEVTDAIGNIFEFSKAFTAAAWLKHFGSEMIAPEVFRIHGAANISDVAIPFFVGTDRLPKAKS